MTDKQKSLKIGISAFFQYSFFSNGIATTSFSLADALEQLGHKPVLINANQTVDWYEDCHQLKDKFERRHLVSWDEKKYDKLDIFIDVDGYIVSNVRRKIADRVIIFIRKPTALNEIEHSVYPLQGPIRNLKDCDALWTWEHFGQQDARILELLSEKPVYRIPYYWSSKPVDEYGKVHPSWLEASKTPADSWSCHITETNQSVSSNLTLPVVIMAYVKTHSKVPLKKYYIHNAQNIKEQKFFEDNVYNHCKRDDLEVEFVGRQRITDWRIQSKSFVLSHTRFASIRGTHLDCVWNGIPLIHNSPWLRDFGVGYYYNDNSIKEAKKAIETMVQDYNEKKGMFVEGALQSVRSKLTEVFNIKKHTQIWNQALSFSKSEPLLEPLPVPTTTKQTTTTTKQEKTKTELLVGFSDLWQSANHEYNFWILLLQEACSKLNTPLKVKGIKITEENVKAPIDLLIFNSFFGNVWRSVPESVPKIHITGENTKSVFGNGIVLNLGFEPTNKEKGIYRFPLWTQYIDWFGADQDRLENPRSMPIDLCTKVDPALLAKKKKFCAFVVSNPYNSIRNDAFKWLSQYKQVDSAGRLFNNVGDVIFSPNAGGGGGELKKLEFLKDYKFCITYENSRGEGYITEKWLAAKAAGCVPIYWGDLNPTQDLPEGSFIDANSIQSEEELIEAVKKFDENDALWLSAAEKPAIQLDKERKRLAEVARLVLEPVLGEAIAQQIPLRLGASSTAEAAQIGIQRESETKLSKPTKIHNWNQKTLLVTCATQNFLPSLVQWLSSCEVRVKTTPTISIRVYLGEDVNEQTLNALKVEHSMVDFRRLPTKRVAAPGFPDLWDPQHFAWKLWMLQDLVQESRLQNTLVWYMDCASIVVRWPQKWFEVAVQNGLVMLEDKEQKNEQWCHEEFCVRLSVTEEEKKAQQLWAGSMCFIGGAYLPWKVFTEAWVYAQQRGIIVGPKWAGLLPDGRPYGHRHDQSILSILRLRHKVPVEQLETVYNDESLRRTYKAGAALYVHRGNLKEHVNFAPRIGEVHLINLARRPDRIQKFKMNHESSWTKQVCLCPAYDGKQIKMTPAIARLFAPNDFLWKKAIMGCALSHLSLWLSLAQEQPCCENYLILEDDVKFQPGWLSLWEEAAKDIPEDYDVLYLGGVLPPNRGMFQKLLEPVNSHWARVAPNQIFNQQTPTRYFHFCNYSYILSRKGAQKILEGFQKFGGYHTSADHMICNRIEDMKHYVLIPQVAGCYQDDDPKYASSVFNDFNRVDSFDSDLWNNDERFGEVEIKENLKLWPNPSQIALGQVLEDAKSALLPKVEETPKIQSGRFFTVGEHSIIKEALLEYSWLKELLGSDLESVQRLPVNHEPLDSTPIFLCMKPHWKEYYETFINYESIGKEFIVVHLSDEILQDPVEFYKFRYCKQVIRMYPRANVPCPEKVYTIPLGPYRRIENPEKIDSPRSNVWSFYGTSWKGRKEKLNPLFLIGPNQYKFYDSWMDMEQLDKKEYSNALLNSIFIPCPGGNNIETFRFWEALEHGAIPLYVRSSEDQDYFKFLSSHLPLISLESWSHAADFMKSLAQNPPTLVHYRKTIYAKWLSWKEELKRDIQKLLLTKA